VEAPGPILRITLQVGGGTEKTVLQLNSSDLIADLKAEIAKWWETLEGNARPSGAPVLGQLLMSEGPLRLITQGQEISSEYDERSLMDVGFKDNQMVYVSMGGKVRGRRDLESHMLQPPPPKDCLPTLLLLKSPYFEQLFSLMQKLGDMKMTTKGGLQQPHTKAQLLSRRVWEILAMLPTCPSLFQALKMLSFEKDPDNAEESNPMTLQEILSPRNLQKFMYALHIVESLCKSKFSGGPANNSERNGSAAVSSSSNKGSENISSLSVKKQLQKKLTSMKTQNQQQDPSNGNGNYR
jgi:ubiquitin carboxyl-terminal hydrolase 34